MFSPFIVEELCLKSSEIVLKLVTQIKVNEGTILTPYDNNENVNRRRRITASWSSNFTEYRRITASWSSNLKEQNENTEYINSIDIVPKQNFFEFDNIFYNKRIWDICRCAWWLEHN